jgi:hypothetical protein
MEKIVTAFSGNDLDEQFTRPSSDMFYAGLKNYCFLQLQREPIIVIKERNWSH